MNVRGAILSWCKQCVAVDSPNAMVLGERSGRRVALREVTAGVEKGLPAVSYLSVRDGIARWLEAPFGNMQKALRVLPALLDVELPFPIEEAVFDVVCALKTDRGTVRILAVVSRIASVKRRIDELAAAGHDPVVIDHEGLALWTQSLDEIPSGPGERRVVAGLYDDRWTLAIGSGDDFVGSHCVRPGDVEHAARLVKMTFGPASQGGDSGVHKVKWIWAGPGATERSTLNPLSEMAARLGRHDEVLAERPAGMLARAVAVRALQGGAFRCNLRTGTLISDRLASRRKIVNMRAAAMFAAGGVMMLAAAFFIEAKARLGERELSSAFAATAERVTGTPVAAKGEQALRIMNESADRVSLELGPFMEAFEVPLTSVVAEAVKTGAASKLRFDALSVTRRDVRIAGSGPAWNSAEALENVLRSRGYDVRLVRKEAAADGSVPFSISTREEVK